MKPFLTYALMATLASGSLLAEPSPLIQEAVLDAKQPLTIAVGSKTATTLYFPEAVETIIGYGLTDGEAAGSYHYEHPDQSRLVTLRNMLPGKQTFMTVVMGEELYVFHLKSSETPVVALKLHKQKPLARKLEAEEVTSRRLNYSVEGLLNLLKLAKGEAFLRRSIPEIYRGVESRYVKLERDYGDLITVITSIHRFPDKDTLVFAGELHNKNPHPLVYDPTALRVRVGDREYSPTLADASGKVAASSASRFYLVLKGNASGSRAHLSINNDFRVMMPESPATPQPSTNGSK